MGAWKQIIRYKSLFLLVLLLVPAAVWAIDSSSAHYQVDQVQIGGAGGVVKACSTSYCAKQSAGELATGSTASSNYSAQAGFSTTTPYLEMTVSTTSLNFGVISSGTTATGTATFKVKSYLASSYVVTNASNGPTNGGHTASSPSTPSASNSTTEEFGINLVKNTSCSGLPPTLGADPVQVPDNTFSFGQAATGYNTPCLFKYINGDTIVQSNKSSGETDYTISYIFNISPTTAGGSYAMDHVLVATSTF